MSHSEYTPRHAKQPDTIRKRLAEAFDEPSPYPRGAKLLSSLVVAVSLFDCGSMFYEKNRPHIDANISAATSFTPLNNRVSAVASNLNHFPVRVDCNDASLDQLQKEESGKKFEIAGVVEPFALPFGYVSAPVTIIREDLCTTIDTYNPIEPAGDPTNYEHAAYFQDTIQYAEAIDTLLHEEEHINQVFKEAEAECHAIQKLPKALRDLGINAITAHQAAKVVAQLDQTLPPVYLSNECRPGGSYDLKLGDIYVEQPDTLTAASPSNEK